MTDQVQQHQLSLAKFISPALNLLPQLSDVPLLSLFPIQELKFFQGLVSSNETLNKNNLKIKFYQGNKFYWIGNAFSNIIYRRYPLSSYEKINDRQQLWNIYAYDLSSLSGQKPQPKREEIFLEPFYKLKQQNDQTLIFQSRFQSGNLSLASKISDSQYNLLLQNDINTRGYTQWFFFKVSNTRFSKKIKFNIVNFYKQTTLYQVGMKILIYSKKKSQKNNISWHRGGQDINYYQNGLVNSQKSLKKYYTLSWNYNFEFDNDQVYFAYNYPYTYTDLNLFFKQLEKDKSKKKYLKRTLLTKSILGNRLDLLTITENSQNKKKYIVISARVHSGQTVSSYVMKGMINFLLSQNEKAISLRQNFIFKIIPMLNPDGVIHGNYRTNLSGHDLNRVWQFPSSHRHPQIYNLKKLILKLQEDNQIVLFCDLHGHSIKKNSFVYGCHNYKNPFQGKQFPFLISKLWKGFNFKDCRFLTSQIREGSARATLFKQLEINNIFTLQSSFCGPQNNKVHFSIQNFEELGRKFCEAILIYFVPKLKVKNKSRQNNLLNETICEFREQALKQLYNNKNYLKEVVKNQNSQGSEPEKDEQNALKNQLIKKYVSLSKRYYSENPKLVTEAYTPIEPKQNLQLSSSLSISRRLRSNSKKKIIQKSQQKEQKILKIKPTVFCTDNFLKRSSVVQDPKRRQLSQSMKIKKQRSQIIISKQKNQEIDNESNLWFQKIQLPHKYQCLLSIQTRQIPSRINLNLDKNIKSISKIASISPPKLKKSSQDHFRSIPKSQIQEKKFDFVFEKKKQKVDYNLFKSVLKSLKTNK